MTILYYDGKCRVCAKEIWLLNKLKNTDLKLVDLWQVETEIPTAELQKVLHLQTPDGTWIKGLEANIMAWQFTRIGFIWKLLRLPIINSIANQLYSSWAEKRQCKMPQ